MKKEDKNKIKNMAIILIYLFIICICLTWGGFHVYHIGLINEAQLGYLGAIIGGGMTLLGVIFTINHTNAIREKDKEERDKERREELAIQYKPHFLNAITYATSTYHHSPKLTKKTIRDSQGEIINSQDILTYVISLKTTLLNSGRGEAIIKEITQEKWSIDTSNINIICNKNKNEIFPEENLELTFKFTIYNIDEILKTNPRYEYVYLIKYTDLFEQHYYTKEVYLTITEEKYKAIDNDDYNLGITRYIKISVK